MMRIAHLLLLTTALATPGFAETAGVEKDQLTLGFIKLTDMAPLAIAKEKGFFADEGLDVTLEAPRAAAMTLKAPPLVVFWRVVFPLTLPGVVIGQVLVFLNVMADFATVATIAA